MIYIAWYSTTLILTDMQVLTSGENAVISILPHYPLPHYSITPLPITSLPITPLPITHYSITPLPLRAVSQCP